ncbi:MAG: tRNA uridine-5-carboxymethylaminomethyl(34) synthesis enzyme MnmG, partial [Candidatus Binatia bacterium]
DNADLRLTGLGSRIGLARPEAYLRTEEKKKKVGQLLRTLDEVRLNPTREFNQKLASAGSTPMRNVTSLAQLLRRPEMSLGELTSFYPPLSDLEPNIAFQAEVEVKYKGYVQRQLEGVERFQKMEQVRIPESIDYGIIQGLSREVREKLVKVRPRSLGQASRISGVTPAAISLLSVYLKKQKIA